MTAVQEALEQESIEHLDESLAIPCEVRAGPGTDPCGKPAAWLLICRHCPWSIAECSEHRANEAVLWARPDLGVACMGCYRVAPGQLWPILFRLQPIEGRP